MTRNTTCVVQLMDKVAHRTDSNAGREGVGIFSLHLEIGVTACCDVCCHGARVMRNECFVRVHVHNPYAMVWVAVVRGGEQGL